MGRSSRTAGSWIVAPLLALVAFAACDDGEPALARGDRLWADSSFEDALAEYRLALRQSGGDESVLIRVAHAYAVTGELEQAREHYQRLLARAPEYTDQAVYDYVTMARRASERGDGFGIATAVEEALALRPELPIPDLSLSLARYYGETGDAAKALEFYQRALSRSPEEATPELLYEIGVLNAGRGNCGGAMDYFSAYRQRAPQGPRVADARWRTGECAFRLAKDAHQQGDLSEALAQLGTVIQLGVPENVQDQAWFDRGEILYAIGRTDEALDAYRRVLELSRSRTSLLAERAQRRIDQIRFGS